mgnify:CR=1 FL=1
MSMCQLAVTVKAGGASPADGIRLQSLGRWPRASLLPGPPGDGDL